MQPGKTERTERLKPCPCADCGEVQLQGDLFKWHDQELHFEFVCAECWKARVEKYDSPFMRMRWREQGVVLTARELAAP